MSDTFVDPPWKKDSDRLGEIELRYREEDQRRQERSFTGLTGKIDKLGQFVERFADRVEALNDAQEQRTKGGKRGRDPGPVDAGEETTEIIPGRPSPAASVGGGGRRGGGRGARTTLGGFDDDWFFGGPGGGAGGSGGRGAGAGGGGGGGAGGDDGPPEPGDPGPDASVAPGGPPIRPTRRSLWGNIQGMSFAGPNLTSMERAQIRLGQFPSYGLSQALFSASWMAGTAGWRRAPEEETRGLNKDEFEAWGAESGVDTTDARQDDNGNWFLASGGQLGGVARQTSVVTGAMGQAIMRGLPIFNRARSFALTNAIAGSQSGLSTSGWSLPIIGGGNTPFMSPAFKHSFGMKLRAAEESWFGFNPNYPTAQATEAQNVIAASGYSGNDANMLAHMMRSGWQNNHFLTPELMMQVADPLMRYGGGNPGDVIDSLKNLGDAAAAAHIGLQQFTESLAQTAVQVTASTGMNIGASVSALKAISTVTRADPSALAEMFSGQNLIMGAAITHQHFSDVMEGRGTATAALALPSRMINLMMGGMNLQQYRRLQRTNPEAAKTIYDRMYYAYNKDPNIFGGMNPRQVLNFLAHNKGGTITPAAINLFKDRAAILGRIPPAVTNAARSQAIMDVENNRALSVSALTHEIREFGGTASRPIYRSFMKDLAEHGGKIDKKDYQQIKKDLLKNMDKYAGTASNQAARQVTIALEPQYARKLFKLVGGSDPSTTNASESPGHKAMGLGGKILHIGEGGAGGAIASAADAIAPGIGDAVAGIFG